MLRVDVLSKTYHLNENEIHPCRPNFSLAFRKMCGANVDITERFRNKWAPAKSKSIHVKHRFHLVRRMPNLDVLYNTRVRTAAAWQKRVAWWNLYVRRRWILHSSSYLQESGHVLLLQHSTESIPILLPYQSIRLLSACFTYSHPPTYLLSHLFRIARASLTSFQWHYCRRKEERWCTQN